jgi:two-component system, LytTR family, response regulator
MTTAVIIDDEPKSVFTLKMFLEEHCPNVAIIGTAGNARDGRELINTVHPQLVFLDIEMPLGSGFDMLSAFPVIDFEIIFITAYNQYAINAFRFSAIDYLLKPLRISHLITAVEKAERRINEKTITGNYELLIRNMNEKNMEKQKLVFHDRGTQYPVLVGDITYLLADGNYTHTHTVQRSFLSAKNLKEFEEMLPPTVFCRIHHSSLVNINFIDSLKKGRGGAVVMKDGKTLEIAVRRKEAFRKMYYGK